MDQATKDAIVALISQLLTSAGQPAQVTPAGTIVAPKTGHVLPLAQWSSGEGMPAYLARAATALMPGRADANDWARNQAGAFLMQAPAVTTADLNGAPVPTDENQLIPLQADKFCNAGAYAAPPAPSGPTQAQQMEALGIDPNAMAAWNATLTNDPSAGETQIPPKGVYIPGKGVSNGTGGYAPLKR